MCQPMKRELGKNLLSNHTKTKKHMKINMKTLAESITASPLVSEPSPLDTIELLGPKSKKFVPPTMLYSYGVANLPEKAAAKLVQAYAKKGQTQVEVFDSLSSSIVDFFRRVKVVGPPTMEQISVPIAEIHRPRVKDCVASLEQTSTKSREYSISVKVFGIGGGYSKSREFGIRTTIEASGECLQIVVPVTVKCEPCKLGAESFIRASIEDIGDVPHAIELLGSADGCGLVKAQVLKLGWKTVDIPVPKKTTQQVEISVQAGQGAEISLELKIGDFEIGPKASVKLLKKTNYSYKLVGPHEYFAYFPKNKLAYNWAYS